LAKSLLEQINELKTKGGVPIDLLNNEEGGTSSQQQEEVLPNDNSLQIKKTLSNYSTTIKDFPSHFYSQHNSEKVSSIKEIILPSEELVDW
jgi:hypothetical protein